METGARDAQPEATGARNAAAETMGLADIVVTGSTGFIGSALVPRLIADGHGVTVLTRDAASAARAKALYPTTPQLALTDLDATNARFHAMVHLAGRAHVVVRASAMEQSAYRVSNTDLTARLTGCAARLGVQRFIFLSSILAVAANTAPRPVSDHTPPAPDTAYGRSKLAAEAHVASFAADGGFGISLRPPLVIGHDAGANWRALQRLADTGLPLPLGAVHNRRSLVDVETLCAAIAHLAGRDWPTELSGAYAIAQPEPVSLTQIVTALRIGMKRPARLVAIPRSLLRVAGLLTGRARTMQSITGDLVVDPTRFLSTFEFAPEMSILDAIAASGRRFKAARKAPQS